MFTRQPLDTECGFFYSSHLAVRIHILLIVAESRLPNFCASSAQYKWFSTLFTASGVAAPEEHYLSTYLLRAYLASFHILSFLLTFFYLRRVPLVFSSTLRKIVCKPFTILCQRDTYEANGHVCFRRSRRSRRYKRSRRYSLDGF